MRVLVTGGTGFIGSHTVAALRAAGHDIRLFVRSPDRIGPALALHGIDLPEHVIGDIPDVPFHIPAEDEGLLATAADTRIDTSTTTADLGVVATPWETTARDTIRWLHSAGHITCRQAGAAAAGAA